MKNRPFNTGKVAILVHNVFLTREGYDYLYRLCNEEFLSKVKLIEVNPPFPELFEPTI